LTEMTERTVTHKYRAQLREYSFSSLFILDVVT
jgi:hypothetical protein